MKTFTTLRQALLTAGAIAAAALMGLGNTANAAPAAKKAASQQGHSAIQKQHDGTGITTYNWTALAGQPIVFADMDTGIIANAAPNDPTTVAINAPQFKIMVNVANENTGANTLAAATMAARNPAAITVNDAGNTGNILTTAAITAATNQPGFAATTNGGVNYGVTIADTGGQV